MANDAEIQNMEAIGEEKISFYRDVARRCMVLSCGNENTDDYRYRMLAVNQIPGLLSCDIRYIETRCCIYYDIAGKQSLKECADAGKLSEDACFGLIRSLIQTEKKLSEYLLDASGILLNPSCIYENPVDGNWYFAYSPAKETVSTEDRSLSELSEYLALRIDMTCKKAAALVLRLCTLSANPNYVLNESILEDEDEEMQEIPGEPPFHSAEPGEIMKEIPGTVPGGIKTDGDMDMLSYYDYFRDEDNGNSEKKRVLQSDEDESQRSLIEPRYEIALAFILWALALFIGWFGSVMRLRNQEKIIDLAVAGTMAVYGGYFLIRHLLRWIHNKTKSTS